MILCLSIIDTPALPVLVRPTPNSRNDEEVNVKYASRCKSKKR